MVIHGHGGGYYAMQKDARVFGEHNHFADHGSIFYGICA